MGQGNPSRVSADGERQPGRWLALPEKKGGERNWNKRIVRWKMSKKIDVLGLHIDNYTVREAMLKIEGSLDNTAINTVQILSMRMLMMTSENGKLKEYIEQLDTGIIGDREILSAVGVNNGFRLKETVENDFLEEFFKKLMRRNKTIYILAETAGDVEKFSAYIRDFYERLEILGAYALETAPGNYDAVVNDVNIAAPDVIVSLLSPPYLEDFILPNKNKLNVRIWFGIGNDFAARIQRVGVGAFVKRLLYRGIFHRRISKYNSGKPPSER